MSVHCIQVKAAADTDADKIRNKVSDLKSKYGEKLAEQNTDFSLVETLDGETRYYSSFFRLTIREDKEKEKKSLTDQIEKELEKSGSWFEVKRHECDHDEDQSTGCSWDYTNSSGSVPESV